MEIFINITITILAFVMMEGVAWLSHKYLMHGLFWYFHEDHHKTTPWKKYANKYEKKSSSIDSSTKGVQVQTVGN